jgi:GNAT superfamily N-acetyltransferase
VTTGTIVSGLTSRQFLGEIDAAVAIYANAMEADPAMLPGRRELMRRHAGFSDFRALLARSTEDNHIVGFAYGFHGQAGQWWYDSVWTALSSTLGLASAASWLADCFEVAEVHVDKQHQRGGIGTRMLTMLTHNRPERTALLSTPDRDTTARRLYRRLGFSELVTGYSFPGGSPPYILMGVELPLRDPTADPIRPLSASPSIS